jgi:hypothetical protein
MSASEAETGPQRAMTIVELYDALVKKLEENDQRSAKRDMAIINEVEAIKATLVHHDKRIGVLERNSPAALARPLWAITLLFVVAVVHMWWRG